MSLTRSLTRSITRGLTRGLTVGGGGGGADPGVALLAEARIYIDWSDAANHSGKYAINQNDPRTVTPNVLAFPTGPIVNEAGSANPARTNNYVNGPGGTLSATRITSNGTNQVCYLCRPSLITPTLPNGTFSIRYRGISNAGGDQTVNMGLASNYLNVTLKQLDWLDPANVAATTFEREFTYAGSSDIAIRLPASGQDISVDCIQFHDGPLSTMPSWADYVSAGGRKAFAFADSIVLDADGLADTTGQTSGLLVFDPDFPARHTYSAYTTMVVASINATPSANAHLANTHPDDGGTTTANVIMADGTSPYQGEIVGSAGSSSRAYHAANLAGYGVFIAGQGRSATQRVVFIDSVPAVIEDRAFAGVSSSRFTVGGFNTSNVADLRANLATGKYAYYVRWDRLLSNEEWRQAAATIRAQLVARGVSLAPINDYHVISGDSNGTRANGDWTQLVTAKDYLSPGGNLICSVTSVGGQGLGNLENGTGAGGAIDSAGRFRRLDAPALLAGTDFGRYSLYHICVGTNDYDHIGTVGAYVVRIQAMCAAAMALNPRVHVMWYSLLPQTATSRPNWETDRLAINAAMIAWAATQDRVHICDFGGSTTIGSRALQAGGGGPYYLSDEIHLNTAPNGEPNSGDAEAALIAGAAVTAWRAELGI